MNKAIFICLSLAIVSCRHPEAPKPALIVRPTLLTIAEFDPIKDADASVAQGDIRFCALRGYGIYVPGVPDGNTKLFTSKQVWVIEGTSDVSRAPKEERMCRQYAEQYNGRVVEDLKKNSGS